MVKQRFLTHFKPWLIAVCKAGALIVGYPTLRSDSHASSTSAARHLRCRDGGNDRALCARVALCLLGVGESGSVSKMRRFRGLWSYKLAFATQRKTVRK